MKTFEHEVLTFNASTKNDYVGMQGTLREWGHAGYEIVSVTTDSVNSMAFTVFLKRDASDGAHDRGETA